MAWRDDYEQTDEYDQMRALYEAEFTYMQHQERREGVMNKKHFRTNNYYAMTAGG